MVVAVICAIYVILGTAMEELSMILLTMPVFFPLDGAAGLRSGLVRHHHRRAWWRSASSARPVGMNMFVLKTLLPQVPTAPCSAA